MNASLIITQLPGSVQVFVHILQELPTPPHPYNNSLVASVVTSGEEVIKLMLERGVVCNVVDNWSVVEKNEGFGIERGCVITLCGIPNDQIEERVWNVLKDKYGLKCAYLHIKGQFRGCIRNFLRDSSCPGC